MNDANDRFRSWLIEVLDVLTWPADQQLDYIRGLGVGIDEMALQFDDAFRIAINKVDERSLDAETFDLLKRIDERFGVMTKQGGSVWNEEGLSRSSEWQDIRALATEARSKLNDGGA